MQQCSPAKPLLPGHICTVTRGGGTSLHPPSLAAPQLISTDTPGHMQEPADPHWDSPPLGQPGTDPGIQQAPFLLTTTIHKARLQGRTDQRHSKAQTCNEVTPAHSRCLPEQLSLLQLLGKRWGAAASLLAG